MIGYDVVIVHFGVFGIFDCVLSGIWLCLVFGLLSVCFRLRFVLGVFGGFVV